MMKCMTHRSGSVVYGISTREGGVDFRSIAEEHGRRRVNPAWEDLRTMYECEAVFCRTQVHGIACEWVDAHSSPDHGVADALVMTTPRRLIAVTVADCCGVVVWSHRNSFVACIHSGWRGTQQNIVGVVVKQIVDRLGVPTADMHAWLSPCASGRSYRVRSDVQKVFPAYCVQTGEDQFLFDNSAAIRDQLLTLGLPFDNISVSDECTIEDQSYHSYRRDGVQSGRNAVFAFLQD